MGNTYCVGYNRVEIYDNVQERLIGAVIRIGFDSNKTNNAVCGTVTSDMISESTTLEILCTIQGRYISIHTPDALTVCEVQAYASECGEYYVPTQHNAHFKF